jgi:Ca2+-binding EF-hand superfamily protein
MIETINQYFKQVDVNLDGSIDRMQLTQVLHKLKIDDLSIIKKVASELDPNHLNFITYNQFLNFSFNAKIPKLETDSGKLIYVSLVDIAEEF